MGPSVEVEVSIQGKVEVRRPKILLNELSRVGLAEFLATYIMMTLGLGSVAQVVTGDGVFGTFFSINIGFGLAVAMGVHIGGTVSGAHMNAAVSFALCVFGQLPWKRLPLYIFAQLFGSFLAAATVFAVYYDAISDYSGGNLTVTGEKGTAGIFATYPAPYLSVFGGFFDQVFGTAILLLCLMALSDEKNKPAAKGTESIFVGLLVVLIGISLGSNSGYAINPTRDFGPRLFTAMAGWGLDVFRAGNYWFWVPIVATPIGAVLGAGLYKICVQMHHPDPSEQYREKGPSEE
ncbi:aquaporin-7 [Gambusia affinis]|uniref:aquaporin-7 n=1 Tax=Gambusia affinis TaxID=33528 RepID=UPI000F3A6721|nr:aquaporin-7 [Gambusia affinis]XP_043978780.1 aquaporin-7 [Gambusia affinis]XP_043978781.1 aquaporin-7 [Gambusia affinis]XP_043978782.1 aquaporin-7 [Gambusia affinis]XP_043978783.1 aquaporin-7 [Gambusia affinis]XP_043978784.1 aquaporin-7 [Gambusia affinis]